MLTGNAFENLAWRPVFERLMRTNVIIKRQPNAQAPACLGHRFIRSDIDLFVFQAPPQTFDENVVQIPALAIHADPDTPVRQVVHERGAERVNDFDTPGFVI